MKNILDISDLGAAAYLFTKLKGSFSGVARQGQQAIFQFHDSDEVRVAVKEYFCDRDGFLSYRNTFNSLKTLAKQICNETYT